MVTYEQWNKAIISCFFENCEPSEIVFLRTDANTLLEIAEKFKFDVADADKAADSLAEAVRDEVVDSDSVDFWKINPTQIFRQGNRSAEEPSQVAFLALSVLAASLMDSGDSIGANNYYIRLNELLFGQSVKGYPPGFNRHTFEDFWKHLQKWARDQHNVELYLTEGPISIKYVWYAKSQCLISMRDRRAIYQFFSDHNLTPFSKISDSQLEKKFRPWLRGSAGSTKIERYFSNNSYKQSILSQVKSLLEHWDGEIPPEPLQGKRQTTASINIELRSDVFVNNAEIRYWIPTRGRKKIRCKTNPLGIQDLQPSHLEKWFQPVIDRNGTFWNLRDSLQLQTDETNPIIYTLGLSDIWVFREDPERDHGWLSERYMHLYEDHLIMFHKRLASQVIDCLGQTCEEELEEPSPIYVSGKENDWLYLRIKPTNPSRFSDPKLWRLSVVSSKRISLIGGLSVKDQHGRRTYLDICLPDVLVPKLGFSDQKPLRIDDQEFSLDEERLVRLNNALGPGVYQLTYGGQTRELRIISPEYSSKHRDQTLIACISENQTSIPTYAMKKISEVLKGSGVWLTGAKHFGNIPLPLSPTDDEFSKVPAHIISSVVKVAIDIKKGKTSVPEWFDEAIEYLDQNITLRSLVEKKLDSYDKAVLSYMELRKQIGK